jgi:hypothetical protein
VDACESNASTEEDETRPIQSPLRNPS